jgi:hypothetical protein
MSSKQTVTLPAPVNVRIPQDLLETIRHYAADTERTLSSQIRFMLRVAVRAHRAQVGNES